VEKENDTRAVYSSFPRQTEFSSDVQAESISYLSENGPCNVTPDGKSTTVNPYR
jgi:hypothetical protein